MVALMQPTDRVRNIKEPEVEATIVFMDAEFITVLVDGYAASNSYPRDRFEQEWEII
jgi:hypothetical protein